MGKGCALPNCPNSKTYGKYVKGFGFPKSEELRNRWISIIQMNCPTWNLTKYPRFCSLHFDKNDIIDGKNNKLQFSAVPLYFNENIRDENDEKVHGPNTKISTLLGELQQNQLLYSSDSECEYQVMVKVVKKPRNSSKSTRQVALRCDFCHKNKKNAVELQSHLRTIHDVIVDIVTPKTASVQIKEDDVAKNYMCSICGLVFRSDPLMAIAHMENGHKTTSNEPEPTLEYVELTTEEEPQYVELIEDSNIQIEDLKADEELAVEDENMVTYVEQPLEESTILQSEDDIIEEHVQTTYKCKLCNIDFVDREEVKAHVLELHTKPVEESSDDEKEAYEPICYICKQEFSSLAKMRKHIKRQHKCEECYYCAHCTGTFLSLDMYEDHECLEPMII
ncbi:zinc finger Y-chromosomal protein 1-like [Culicoides brevitarsis]|uniref:zinc finger Y-chromosomal protein 1-like n=1 Tax=Culicoides brevitarsis TaxID=469753 RepID=UPI00307B35CB